jgi:uncharacterized protein (TIGR02466 family)
MIVDTKAIQLFPVEMHRIVTDLDHKAITEYTLEHKKTWKGYTTYHDQEINRKWMEGLPDRDKLQKCMVDAGREYLKRTKRPSFTDYGGGSFLFYWASVYNQHDQHGAHIHANSLVAGTYYPSAGAESSSITFEAPWSSHIMHDQSMVNQSTYKYKPNSGDMLLWPAWLTHRVEPQRETTTNRIAISFNLDYKKYHD